MKQTCSDQLTDELGTATEKTTNQLERSAQLRTRATQTAASIEPNHMTIRTQKWLAIIHFRVGVYQHKINSEWSKTLSQCPSYNLIHSSSYMDLAVREK